MENQNVLVFSHEQDVDGVFSAAILRITHGDPKIILTNYGFENSVFIKNKIISFVNENPSGKIIIADMGPNPESISPIIEGLTFANENKWKCIWIDHHIWSDDLKSRLGPLCELVLCSESGGEKKCTAELCIERFAVKNELAVQLAAIARRTDFPDSTKFPIPPLTALISYYVGFPRLHDRLVTIIIDSIAKGVLWNTEMQADIIEASRLIDESIDRSVRAMTLRELSIESNVYRIAIVKADSFVSRSILLGRVMDENDIDVAVAFTSDGKVSLRRKDNQDSQKILVDCSKIAQEFREGGGHAGAAGGFLSKSASTEAGDSDAQDEITKAVESYLTKQGAVPKRDVFERSANLQ